ncbi:hypothetical protein BDZ45DRAFT_181088 [Acephala macrosclerotiorum]|nr:hypothetical protein BDZ45DRAFT_181088 [Acephala macrosclerotiorum]
MSNYLPTTTTYTPCPTHCFGTCCTYYTPILASCSPTSTSFPPYAPPPPSPLSPPPPTTPTTTIASVIELTLTTITTQPSYCSTIMVDAGPECWSAGCETTYSRCNVEKTVTLECGCWSIPRVTSCKKTCDGECLINWGTGYLPCPTSPLGTVVSLSGY